MAKPKGGFRNNLVDKEYGRLIVIAFAGNDKHNKSKWLCKCKCGKYKVVAAGELNKGDTNSCGCIRREHIIKLKTIHGMCHTPEYKAYHGMLERCYNKNSKDYKYYGGKGIAVCSRWLESFDNFYADMGPKPEPKKLYSLHRVIKYEFHEPDYSPENCKWATWEEQNHPSQRSPLY